MFVTVKTLFRMLGVPLTALALGVMLTTSSALAGGGDPPTGPNFQLGVPAFAVNGAGQLVVGFTLVCGAEEVAEGAHVDITVNAEQQLGRRLATGFVATEATCAAESQPVTLVLASLTDNAFRAGPVYAVVEFGGCSSNGCGYAFGDFEGVARRVRSR